MSRSNRRQPEYLTVEDVAARLGVSESWVDELIANQQIPHIVICGVIRIPSDKLERWIEAAQVVLQPAPQASFEQIESCVQSGEEDLKTKEGVRPAERVSRTCCAGCSQILDEVKKLSEEVLRAIASSPQREWYDVKGFATLVDRDEQTVRRWCREKRINAEKSGSGRGVDQEWRISHQELLRYQKENLIHRPPTHRKTF